VHVVGQGQVIQGLVLLLGTGTEGGDGNRKSMHGVILSGRWQKRTSRRRRWPSDEFDELVQLLLDHRSDDAEQTEWLAYAVASGCMGGDHLYQDMGLPDRQALSDLMARHFGTLMAKNSANMKWKKFLYKQLCDRAEVCSDYQKCFGPEDDRGLGALAVASGRAARETQPV
jgi:hypothetical protein